MLKDGLGFIWELDMKLVFTLVDRPKSGQEPFGMGQMATFEAKINLGAKTYYQKHSVLESSKFWSHDLLNACKYCI